MISCYLEGNFNTFTLKIIPATATTYSYRGKTKMAAAPLLTMQ